MYVTLMTRGKCFPFLFDILKKKKKMLYSIPTLKNNKTKTKKH